MGDSWIELMQLENSQVYSGALDFGHQPFYTHWKFQVAGAKTIYLRINVILSFTHKVSYKQDYYYL